MAHVLQNEHVVLRWEAPGEHYRQSRFDWTGNIVGLEYRGIPFAGLELFNDPNPDYGRGFYNEFGMHTPLGFDEAPEGDWFHKIGVGLLQKDGPSYNFYQPYAISPARFEIEAEDHEISILCRSALVRGYAYKLEKTIRLLEHGFVIHYTLTNTGSNAIKTDEYTHNFLAIDKAPIDTPYELRVPFDVRSNRFDKTVNPEGLVLIGEKEIRFAGIPSKAFFFSNLSGGENVAAQWQLRHKDAGVGISETGDFTTSSMNLWGMGHVISPELFITIEVLPGESLQWQRRYDVFDI